MNGSVTLYLGSMKSGKTSKLYEVIDQAKYRHKKVLFLRPKMDTREFISRNKDNIEYKSVRRISDLNRTELMSYDIICIDEGQFFKFLGYEVETHLASFGKEVYISALNGDTDMKPWEEVSNLIPYCDKIYRLSAVCEDCKDHNRATFSSYDGKKDKIEVGSEEKYHAFCRSCYYKRNENG